jgi:hypothetical protein
MHNCINEKIGLNRTAVISSTHQLLPTLISYIKPPEKYEVVSLIC